MKHAFTVIVCLLLTSQALWSQETPNMRPTQDTVTISREEFESLKARVDELRQQVQQLLSNQKAPQSEQPEPKEIPAESQPQSETGGRYLALPDISLIVQAVGKLSSDKRDEGRNRLRVNEAELAIQGYVYPNVKADAFLATSPEEGVAMQVEEAYLTYLSPVEGLNAYVGEKHVPFGRTNLLHPHSLPYARQPLALRNLIAHESLIGEGIEASYLIPTRGKLFGQVDLGTWTKSGHSHEHKHEEGEDGDEIVAGEGAGFTDRFNTARFWLGYPVSEDGELELGASYANGSSHGFHLGIPSYARLTGLDATYRRFWENNRRLLLRGEIVRRKEEAGSAHGAANGYYLFGSYRPDKYNSIGLLYDWSEFPQLPGSHESALSLILTKQFSEQYYLRLHGTRGNRPGEGAYNELLLQWVWGIGPHTHNLE